jgi:hypothetical protein
MGESECTLRFILNLGSDYWKLLMPIEIAFLGADAFSLSMKFAWIPPEWVGHW